MAVVSVMAEAAVVSIEELTDSVKVLDEVPLKLPVNMVYVVEGLKAVGVPETVPVAGSIASPAGSAGLIWKLDARQIRD